MSLEKNLVVLMLVRVQVLMRMLVMSTASSEVVWGQGTKNARHLHWSVQGLVENVFVEALTWVSRFWTGLSAQAFRPGWVSEATVLLALVPGWESVFCGVAAGAAPVL